MEDRHIYRQCGEFNKIKYVQVNLNVLQTVSVIDIDSRLQCQGYEVHVHM